MIILIFTMNEYNSMKFDKNDFGFHRVVKEARVIKLDDNFDFYYE